jgi:nitrilase
MEPVTAAPVVVAAVQAAPVLLDPDATIGKVIALAEKAAADGARLVAFPEAFVPGTPIWIDTQAIWDGDDEWFGLLAGNAVVVPGPAAERLTTTARTSSASSLIRPRGPRSSRRTAPPPP